MRLWILSDLHLEANGHVDLPIPDADVAVVAGDVCTPMWKSVQWLDERIGRHMPVVFVPGNHEFFGGSIKGCTRRGLTAAAATDGRVTMLCDSDVVIGGVRFAGGTLWTDYALGAASHRGKQRDMDIAHAMHTCGSLMADHAAIHLDDDMLERWQPEHARVAFHATKIAILDVLRDAFRIPTVIVTHHAPSGESVEPRFEHHPTTPAYASDLTELIWDWQPRLWVHGHLHHTTGYPLGSTGVVCNPMGYGTENPGFKPDLVLTVSGR
jgi:hypothetical protein